MAKMTRENSIETGFAKQNHFNRMCIGCPAKHLTSIEYKICAHIQCRIFRKKKKK